MTWESVDLPEPFGPMIAWISPSFTVSVSPWRISRSSTRTCRSFTSSKAILVSSLFKFCMERLSAPRGSALADRPFKRDRDQLLRFHRELHRQLLQHVLDETIDDEADGFFLRKATLDAVEQHILGDLRGRRFVLER